MTIHVTVLLLRPKILLPATGTSKGEGGDECNKLHVHVYNNAKDTCGISCAELPETVWTTEKKKNFS